MCSLFSLLTAYCADNIVFFSLRFFAFRTAEREKNEEKKKHISASQRRKRKTL